MARISLKSLMDKPEIAAIITALAGSATTLCIKDATGKILMGKEEKEKKGSYPLQLADEQIGLVEGDEKAIIIADLLNHLFQKEAEKKKLGAEVLNLYQEINLIFNFSEKLAKTIDASSICAITLDEARHVITSNNGAVILWDESKKELKVTSSSSELFFEQHKINSGLSILRKIVSDGQSEIVTDTSSLSDAGIISPEVKSLLYSALKVNDRVMGAIILGSNESMPYTAAHLKLLTTLALQSSAVIESALLYEKNIKEVKAREEAMRLVYEVTGKFVPLEFIHSLGHEKITDVKLGDQVEKIVTVLFSDIREYTSLSEKMSPEENFSFICAFNARIGPFIRKHNGFVNQYLGDAIMAIFPGNAGDALSAAVEIQKEIEQFNQKRLQQNLSPIKIGVGMHTGPLIMGITGDKDRLDACTISDTVNTASRLEGLTKYYKAGIILSQASLEQIKNGEAFHLRNLGLVQVKGKQETLRIHECFSGSDEEIQRKTATLHLFNEGVQHYSGKLFSQATSSFQKVVEADPDDRTARFFYMNSKQLITEGKQIQKSGIVEMPEK